MEYKVVSGYQLCWLCTTSNRGGNKGVMISSWESQNGESACCAHELSHGNLATMSTVVLGLMGLWLNPAGLLHCRCGLEVPSASFNPQTLEELGEAAADY